VKRLQSYCSTRDRGSFSRGPEIVSRAGRTGWHIVLIRPSLNQGLSGTGFAKGVFDVSCLLRPGLLGPPGGCVSGWTFTLNGPMGIHVYSTSTGSRFFLVLCYFCKFPWSYSQTLGSFAFSIDSLAQWILCPVKFLSGRSTRCSSSELPELRLFPGRVVNTDDASGLNYPMFSLTVMIVLVLSIGCHYVSLHRPGFRAYRVRVPISRWPIRFSGFS
jgi:hypothetical protein